LLVSKRKIENPQKEFRDRTPDPMIHTHVLRLAPTFNNPANRSRTQSRSDPRSHESMDVRSNAHRLPGFRAEPGAVRAAGVVNGRRIRVLLRENRGFARAVMIFSNMGLVRWTGRGGVVRAIGGWGQSTARRTRHGGHVSSIRWNASLLV
jgi:hypothetical protein